MVGERENMGARALLLDRLVDSDPQTTWEAVPLRILSVEELKASIAKQLSDLLSTRRSLTKHDERVAKTTLAYGIGDYSGTSLLDDENKARISNDIRKAILKFEPRLSNVLVKIETPDQNNILAPTLLVIGAEYKIGSVRKSFNFEFPVAKLTQDEK